MATATDKKPFHLALAEKLIGHLESGTAPWQRPWEPGASWLPFNPTSGKNYKGINVLQLLSEERTDPRWMTYKQALAAGAQVRRGEKGTSVQYWKFEDERAVKDADGKPVLNERGEARKENVRLDQPRVFFATVFNAEQIDGLAALERKAVTWNVEEAVEARLALATFKHDQPNRAFYHPATDTIHLPGREQFPDAKSYYHVALHELAHWTGHPSRMNRDLLQNPFGSPEYAREELRAEIASLLMGAETGLGHEPNQNAAAYVSHWVRDLRERPLEIFRAAADAEKIRGLVSELTQTRQPNQVVVPVIEPMKQTAAAAPAPSAPANPPNRPPTAVVVEGAQRIYLAVPFGEKNAAKARGARWDAERKSWYAPNAELAANQLARWRPENHVSRQDVALPPREEFAQVLQGLGFRLGDTHPVLDAKPRRVPVEGDRRGEAAGFYVGYGDGHPAGYAMNNRTGEEVRWKAKGYSLSEEQRSVLAAEAAARLQARERQTGEQQAEAANRVQQQLRGAKPATRSGTPYLAAKQIEATKGTFADKDGRTLLVPGYDVEGKVWTAQYINEDGTKRFAKGSRKEGCFHVVGGMAELNRRPVIVIAEGYATANTLAVAAEGRAAVVSAFDAGNLEPVARVLREKFPDKAFLIAADDDRAAEQNRGREFASKAALAVGAGCITPTFAPGEQAADPKRFTDFNDVKVHSALGLTGLKEQFLPEIEKAAGRGPQVEREPRQFARPAREEITR